MEGMLNYFIPEDGDSSDHMNVVPLPRVEQLKLQHIKKAFPLPGDFHFRFKTAFEGTYVWLDVTNDVDPVPDYNGLIVSKIARIQRESTTRPPERVETKPVPTPRAKPAPDLIETSSPPPAKAPEPVPQAKAFNDDLVGLLSDPVPASSPRTSAAPPAPAAPTQPNTGAPVDPFNLFLGPAASNNSMRPNAPPQMNVPRGPPGGPGPNNQGAGGGFPGGGFAPMGPSGMTSPMAPRPTGNIGISQMGHHMGPNPGQGGPQGPGQGQGGGVGNSFSGLNWQGMGHQQQQQQQQQQPRPGMGMQQNNGSRQW